ncbi:MAG: M20/M25/M40 family metallo-hydrolase [Candidatus Aminicenantes bacterium]|nr:M20/M25/M40 family metallo-hydrolase [Candidatus Aminicenantes bacterium]
MDFLRYFKSQQGEMVKFLKTLVQLESPTSEKKSVDRCSAEVMKRLAGLGVKVKRFPQKEIGDLYLIEYAAAKTKTGAEPILLLTHIDTVWPVGTIEKMPFYLAGDKVFGPGALDMKAGIVQAVFSLAAINNLGAVPNRKIRLFINSAEETGNDDSHRQIAALAKKAGLVLCLEPGLPGGAIKVQRKGRVVVKIECFGRAAHASTPDKGLNAIDELMTQLQRLKKLKIKDMSLNIGLIGGGEKANVVPEKAWAICDLRFWSSQDLDQIKSYLREMKPGLRGARVKASLQSFTPPMEFHRASRELFERARQLAASLGLKLIPGRSGGGSDASIASHLGRPCLDGLGPEGEGMHAAHEHLLLPSFVQRTALLTRLLLEL